MQKAMSRHSPKNRKLGIKAVIDENGNVEHNAEAAADILVRHWQRAFERKPISEDVASKILGLCARRFPTVTWILCFSNFCALFGNLRKSSAGPDGIPYAAWIATEYCLHAVYQCYLAWIQHGDLPVDFNIAYLWLLPKTDDDAMRAQNTRPLSGANACAKMMAMALAASFAQGLDSWASPIQRGFIPGRFMLQNVLDVETAAVCLSRTEAKAAAVFFDYAAAFPSLARHFIWLTLMALQIPIH
eukprot:7089614-Karenia_brevis.AAC.1